MSIMSSNQLTFRLAMGQCVLQVGVLLLCHSFRSSCGSSLAVLGASFWIRTLIDSLSSPKP